MRQKILFGLWTIVASLIAVFISFIVALIILSGLTPNLYFFVISTSLLIYGLTFGLLLLPARHRFTKPVRTAGLLAGLPVLFLGLYFAVPNLVALTKRPVPVDDNLVDTLKSHTIPLTSVDSSDLNALRPYLEGRQVVALGEATHGTSEFFRMKHSVIAYLVTELGFRNYGMEISAEDGAFLNRYIHGEDVDPADVLYWPWATEEIVAMFDWMRQYNAETDADEQLTLYGIDPRWSNRDQGMAENVTEIVKAHGPIVIWAHNAHIWAAEGAAGSYLKRTFGPDAYLIGFEFSQGAFTAHFSKILTYEVGPAPPTYYAYALTILDSPVLFLDMATMQQNPILDEWLNTPQFTHRLDEFYHFARLLPGTRTRSDPLPDLYDALIFIEESTPTKALPSVE